jgi:hypothetical protein
MRFLPLLCLTGLILWPSTIRSEDITGLRPLRTISLAQLDSLLPSGTQILIEQSAIEAVLAALERTPPDWATISDGGHKS